MTAKRGILYTSHREELSHMLDSIQDIEWQEDNLIDSVPHSDWILVQATLHEDKSVTISPGGSIEININQQHIKPFACNHIKHLVQFTGSPDISANYEPTGFSTLDIKYTKHDKRDNNFILLNRDIEVSDNTYTNESVVELKPKEVESLKVVIVNGSDDDLTVHSIQLYKSVDLSPYQIVPVLSEQSIVSELIMSTANFSKAQFTQYLRTNVLSMSALNEMNGGKQVNFLEVMNDEMSFRASILSTDEVEQFKIPIVEGETISYLPVYHAVSPKHPLYGQAFTVVDPRDKFPSMSEEEFEKWKLMVYKEDNYRERLSIRFMEVDDGQGGKVTTPNIVLGEGVSKPDGSAPDRTDMRGRMRLYVDYRGGHIEYMDLEGNISEVAFRGGQASLLNFYNEWQGIDRYDDGCLIYFSGDPEPTSVIFHEDEDTGELLGAFVNGDFRPMPKKSGNVPV